MSAGPHRHRASTSKERRAPVQPVGQGRSHGETAAVVCDLIRSNPCRPAVLPEKGLRRRGLERGTAPEQAVDMTQGPTRVRMTQVALASHVRPGDHILTDGRYVEVLRVRRAQGRKPARGENLHLVGADEVVKINSLDGIRILVRPA